MLANTREIRRHDGPYFDWWRRRVAASVGAELIPTPSRQE